jgi:hypothetical protein
MDTVPDREKERETRTLVVKNVNPAVDDADFKQLFEVRPCLHWQWPRCFQALHLD